MRFAGLGVSLVLFTSAMDAAEHAEIQKAYQQELASAAEPLTALVDRYVAELKKLRKTAQDTGDLDAALVVQSEIDGYEKPGKRNFRDAQLIKLRSIYDTNAERLRKVVADRKLEVMLNYIVKYEELTNQLTRDGDLEGAEKVENLRKELVAATEGAQRAAKPAESTPANLLWRLQSEADYDLVKDSIVKRNGDLWLLSSPHAFGSLMRSKKEVTVPFVISARATTDSKDMRYYFNDSEMVIFNWESGPAELRVRHPLATNAEGFRDKGYLEPNQFHDIEIEVSEKAVAVYVDRRKRGEVRGNFVGLKGTVAIGPAFGSTITIERFEVLKDR